MNRRTWVVGAYCIRPHYTINTKGRIQYAPTKQLQTFDYSSNGRIQYAPTEHPRTSDYVNEM